jgi:MFS family permease
MAGGLIGVATAISLLCLVELDSSPWTVRTLMFLIGVGMAYVFLPNQAASLATISRKATGRATMMMSVQRQLGAAVGVAVLSSVLSAVGPTHRDATGSVIPNLAAYRAAFLVAAAFSLTGALIALGVPDRDAAATMRPRSVRESPREAMAGEAD